MAILYFSPPECVDLFKVLHALRKKEPTLDIRMWPDIGNYDDIDIAIALRLPNGELAKCRNLKAVFSLGAGVDTFLRDPSFPRHVPLTRIVDENQARKMAAYVLCAVLNFQRNTEQMMANQAARVWDAGVHQWEEADMPVGIMGMGVMGRATARLLMSAGYSVYAWTRTRKASTHAATADAPIGTTRLQVRPALDIPVDAAPCTHQGGDGNKGADNGNNVADDGNNSKLANASLAGDPAPPSHSHDMSPCGHLAANGCCAGHPASSCDGTSGPDASRGGCGSGEGTDDSAGFSAGAGADASACLVDAQYAGAEELPLFLSRCRVLVILLPLTGETTKILDAAALAHLPRGACVVNVSRGAVLDTDALLASLDAGHLDRACLDVFETEPLPQESRLWSHPRVRVTPHLAAQKTTDVTVAQLLENRRRVMAGLTLLHQVDPDRGY
eukprot:jgi/Mesvir1/6800/Mv09000-RA.1